MRIPPSVSDSALAPVRPTWYAGGDTWYGEAWTMLHPPYTLMVLSFVVVGAAISPKFSWALLLVTLVAYFLALGIGAHFLDQLPGMGSRYVRHWPDWALWTVGLTGVAAGVAIGVVGVFVLMEPALILLVIIQGVCAVGYPLAPLFGGVLHRDSVFAISWGSLPCLTSYYAQSGSISLGSLLLAATFAVVALVEIRASRMSRELRKRAPVDAPTDVVASAPGGPAFRRPDLILQVLSLGLTLVALGLLASRVLLGG